MEKIYKIGRLIGLFIVSLLLIVFEVPIGIMSLIINVVLFSPVFIISSFISRNFSLEVVLTIGWSLYFISFILMLGGLFFLFKFIQKRKWRKSWRDALFIFILYQIIRFFTIIFLYLQNGYSDANGLLLITFPPVLIWILVVCPILIYNLVKILKNEKDNFYLAIISFLLWVI